MLKFLICLTVITLCYGARIPRKPADIETVEPVEIETVEPAETEIVKPDEIEPVARTTRKLDEIEIVKRESENGADGAYNFMYEGSDGSYREEKAVPMNVGEEDEYLAITGSYRYISAEGKEVEVHYTADTRGFIITGQHIHESSGSRQTKSIQSNEETPSDNPKESLNETPSKSLNESSNKSPTEIESDSSSESSSQTSTEVPSE